MALWFGLPRTHNCARKAQRKPTSEFFQKEELDNIKAPGLEQAETKEAMIPGSITRKDL